MTEVFIRKTVIALRNTRDWVIAQFFFGFIAFLKLFPPDSAIWFVSEAARGLGMKYPRTKLARSNLKMAFPDKPDEEIEEILSEMWANLGRIAAEYIYLDQIFDINEEDQSKGRVEITGADNFYKMKDHDGPVICFTGHTGNWELLPIASAFYGLDITALFRPPNNKYIAERVLSARTTAMGHLVQSKVGASWALANELEDNKTVGMLVDQFFNRGTIVEFFGQDTLASPLLAKLTRQFDCPVYPARCIRLPEGRFRIDIEDEVERHYLANGKLDMQRLTQDMTTRVENWVREYPEQWLWLHKRWRPEHTKKRAEQARLKSRK
jgi:KDO2-lipid IV(A) lauroyltransferase